MRVLVIDIGGSHTKLAIAESATRMQFDSTEEMSPHVLFPRILAETQGWKYDVVSIGYPGRVGPDGPTMEPGNLGEGWVGFDFAAAMGKPVRVMNDAVLQALGAYDGGRMLFLGLGTGLGSALVTERVVVPLELGELPYEGGRTLFEILGQDGFDRQGQSVWQQFVRDVAGAMRRAFLADYVVLGGGRAALVDPLPPHTRRGGNDDAIEGGSRLWREVVEPHDREPSPFWRVVL
jgi:polyphosphate glucokinase